MADPYIIENGYWFEHPFAEMGEGNTRIIYYRCRVKASDYVVPTLGVSNMGSAGSAKIQNLPFTNADWRWCRDFSYAPFDKLHIEFTRMFCNIPAPRNEYAQQAVQHLGHVFGNASEFPGYTFRPGSVGVPVRINYVYSTNVSALIAAKPLISKMSSTFAGFTLGEVVDFVWALNNGSSVTQVSPAQYFSATERVAEPSNIRRWAGDIYEKSTVWFKPRDIYLP